MTMAKKRAMLECGCGCGDVCISCCGGVYPETSLYLVFRVLNETPRCACLDGLEIELTFRGIITNDLDECEVRWEGRMERPCPAGGEFNAIFTCRSNLDSGASTSDLEIYLDNGEGTEQVDFLQGAFEYYSSSCDPYGYCIRSVNANWLADVGECLDASVDETVPDLELCLSAIPQG